MARDDELHDDDAPATGGVQRRAMAGGGEVLSGALVTEALESVGARAMTLDGTIYVADDFDPHSAEDQALYAHERLHQQQSGGDHAHHGGHDEEEKAAQAVERMVLHRRASGEDFGSILKDVDHGQVDDPADAPLAGADTGLDPTDPMGAYRALRKQGLSHEGIVQMLADHVVRAVLEDADEQASRDPLGSSRF